jgi:hypothetical protein
LSSDSETPEETIAGDVFEIVAGTRGKRIVLPKDEDAAVAVGDADAGTEVGTSGFVVVSHALRSSENQEATEQTASCTLAVKEKSGPAAYPLLGTRKMAIADKIKIIKRIRCMWIFFKEAVQTFSLVRTPA